MDSNQQQDKTQDFELVELLFRKQSPTDKFESFKERLQSLIDQIPSYLHSSSKPGFFTHFFLGSFSTVLDTKLAKKIGINNLHYIFDGAKTLKVVAETEKNVYVFIFTEEAEEDHKNSEQTRTRKFEFTQGELNNIKLNQNLKNKIEHGLAKVEVKVVKIDSSKKVHVQDKKMNYKIHVSNKNFEKIEAKRKPDDPLENDINKLSEIDIESIETTFRKILEYVKETHTALNLSDNVYGSKAREANHHGFLSGVLYNFRYRYNTRIYLEQFAGRGYADIVLLVRGANRSTHSIPIIIELKAGTSAGTEPSNARQQAEGYALGFQPNTTRVLTFSNDVICIGLNLDYMPTALVERTLKDIIQIIDDENHIMNGPLKRAIKDKLSEFTEINDLHLVKIIDEWQGDKQGLKNKIMEYLKLSFSSVIVSWEHQDIHPLIIEILHSAKNCFNGEIDDIELKERIESNLRRVFNSFPGTPEKGENHYFSRFLLGQSILIKNTDFKKHIFIYEKDSVVSTEEPGENKTEGRLSKISAASKIKQDAQVFHDTSHAITTTLFIPSSRTEPVYLFNTIESNRDLSFSKKIKLPENIIGNRKICILNLKFRTDKKGESFDSFCKLGPINKYDSLQDYNNKNANLEEFNGKFENIPYPTGLKECFDDTLNAQKKTVAEETLLEKYKKLLEQTLVETIKPFKSLITKEAHFQGVLHGVWGHYSDLKLSEEPTTRAVVLTEFQTGKGKRIDMLIHGIGPSLDSKEYKPVGLEIKGPRKGATDKTLMQEAEKQLENYKTVVYKTLTDGDEVYLVPVVFSPKDNDSLIQLGTELFSVPVVHSSIAVMHSITQRLAASNIDAGSSTSGGGSSKLIPYFPVDEGMLFVRSPL